MDYLNICLFACRPDWVSDFCKPTSYIKYVLSLLVRSAKLQEHRKPCFAFRTWSRDEKSAPQRMQPNSFSNYSIFYRHTCFKTTRRLYRPQNNSAPVQASKQLRACTGLKTTQRMYRPQNNSAPVQASKQLSACTGLKTTQRMYRPQNNSAHVQASDRLFLFIPGRHLALCPVRSLLKNSICMFPAALDTTYSTIFISPAALRTLEYLRRLFLRLLNLFFFPTLCERVPWTGRNFIICIHPQILLGKSS
jgi:hypothetical protein